MKFELQTKGKRKYITIMKRKQTAIMCKLFKNAQERVETSENENPQMGVLSKT